MALTFYVSRPGEAMVTGLSTDIKPTQVPEDSVFIEIDTGKQYRFKSGTWIKV